MPSRALVPAMVTISHHVPDAPQASICQSPLHSPPFCSPQPPDGVFQQFQEGDVAVMHALSSATRNGRRGCMVRNVDEESRYIVRLQSGRVLSLRGENITSVSSPEAIAAEALNRRTIQAATARRWTPPPLHVLFNGEEMDPYEAGDIGQDGIGG